MKLSYTEYKSKLLGCFYGKNIGGTLGAPFECVRGAFDIDFYTTELQGEPIPNDDLDLQLVWLNAVERFGKYIDSSILAEYWLSYITPSWAEYGQAKNNLRMGMLPPLSAFLNNYNRDSCGAFIRSELWACLCPGNPALAAEYTYRDAIVDHTTEGLYAAIFCATLQSAAFVTTDREELIQIALSYIPETCAVAEAIALVKALYEKGYDWKTCRKELLKKYIGTFGLALGYEDRPIEPDIPEGRLGFDAPCNIGIAMIGWFYGEGNFGKSICIAAGCGEDGDCTAATLGALFGILYGYEGIDKKWIEPIGNKIITISINRGDHDCKIPATIEEFIQRILNVVPSFLGSDRCVFHEDENAYTILMNDANDLKDKKIQIGLMEKRSFIDQLNNQPFCTLHQSPVADLLIDYTEPPYIIPGGEKIIKLKFENKMFCQQWLNIKAYLPEGFELDRGTSFGVSLEQYHGNIGKCEFEIKIKVPEKLTQCKNEILLDISFNGRHTRIFAPILLLNAPVPESDLLK